ncbi:MAG: lytic transglycosylase domain-containing protein [Synergistaceae bacterium]|jgi:soluble lytic murein transglycosylase-like protein|nr:lytic transglycosylase domain-containing protein [Synergistaceae bacterium]
MRSRPVNLDKVRNRIEEILRKSSFSLEQQMRGGSVKESESGNRFVEVLDSQQAKGREAKKTQGQRDMDELRKYTARAADKYRLDEELIRAVIQVESGWKSDAVSIKGAQGLMQLMPRTASMLGVEDSFDPEQNIEGGVKYLSDLTDKYEGDIEKALAAYNAGPTRVDSGGKLSAETERYVKNVMALYHRYREED